PRLRLGQQTPAFGDNGVCGKNQCCGVGGADRGGFGLRQAQNMMARGFFGEWGFIKIGGQDQVRHHADAGQKLYPARRRTGEDQLQCHALNGSDK
ncbi:MAG: hypothetical protein RLZZ157_319, partial [Pseudomonadota bacterium]